MAPSCRIYRKKSTPLPYVQLSEDQHACQPISGQPEADFSSENRAALQAHNATVASRGSSMAQYSSFIGMKSECSSPATSRSTQGLIARHFHTFPSRNCRSQELAGHWSQLDLLSSSENNKSENGNATETDEPEHHEDEIVEYLEVIDPQVATVTNLNNAANTILIPPVSIYPRRPVIHLSNSFSGDLEKTEDFGNGYRDELDLHVGKVLRKRDKLRRTLSGMWSFMKTPTGILTSIYGFLVVFWGTALVVFLAGWIHFSSKDRQGFWVEVASQILNALFTITGIGLLPWRVIDTYRIIRIWHFKRLSAQLRKRAGLPELYDEEDLPDPTYIKDYVHVLTDAQQKELHHQQKEFAKSQTWYRPHGTETHKAFPIQTALWICLLVDGNSFFQALLCACMWSMDRFQRPAWTTGSLIPASFLCGIVAAILIWRGTQKSKRSVAVEKRLRDALETTQRVPAGYTAVHVDSPLPIDNTTQRP